jgi:hypothetical protein
MTFLLIDGPLWSGHVLPASETMADKKASTRTWNAASTGVENAALQHHAGIDRPIGISRLRDRSFGGFQEIVWCNESSGRLSDFAGQFP